MGTNWLFIGIFILGVFFQVFLSVDFFNDFRKNLSGFFKALVLSLISLPAAIFLYPDQQQGFFFISVIFFWAAVLPFFMMFFFREKSIFSLNEISLLLVNLVALYCICKGSFPLWLLAVYGLVSCFTIANALIPTPPKRWQKLVFLTWYFILIITISITSFDYSEIYNNLVGKIFTLTPLSFLTVGMAFGHIAVYTSYLYHFSLFRPHLLPAGTTEKEAIIWARKHYEQDKELFASRYEEKSQLPSLSALVLALTVVAVLVTNYYFALISDSVIIILGMSISSFFAKYKTKSVRTSKNL
jgi:hypothetical protein